MIIEKTGEHEYMARQRVHSSERGSATITRLGGSHYDAMMRLVVALQVQGFINLKEV